MGRGRARLVQCLAGRGEKVVIGIKTESGGTEEWSLFGQGAIPDDILNLKDGQKVNVLS